MKLIYEEYVSEAGESSTEKQVFTPKLTVHGLGRHLLVLETDSKELLRLQVKNFTIDLIPE
jgi:hypothetical protein